MTEPSPFPHDESYMHQEINSTNYKNPVCKGSWSLGSACGHCERCQEEYQKMTSYKAKPIPERVGLDTLPTPDNDDAMSQAQQFLDGQLMPPFDATFDLQTQLRVARAALENLLSHARQLQKERDEYIEGCKKHVSRAFDLEKERDAATQRIAELEKRDKALTADYNTYKSELFAAWESVGMKPEQVTTDLPSMIHQLKQERDEAVQRASIQSYTILEYQSEVRALQAKLDGAVRAEVFIQPFEDFKSERTSCTKFYKIQGQLAADSVKVLILPADEQVGKEGK